MTACQKDAKAGLYARAMAAFICWIAPRRDEVLEELEQEKERLQIYELVPASTNGQYCRRLACRLRDLPGIRRRAGGY